MKISYVNNKRMKKIWLLALIVFISLNTWSQTYVGVKGGYAFSTISFKPYQETKLLTDNGLDLGLFFKHYNSKYVGFQAELYRINRGYMLPTDETNTVVFKRVNTYIELPIFLQFRLNLKFAYVHVNAGPYIAYLLSAEEGDNSSGSYKMKSVKFNVLRDKRFDYGLMGGGGLSHDFKWGTIQAEFRVSYGFADFYDHTYADMPQQSKSVTQAINIGYFYRFGATQ